MKDIYLKRVLSIDMDYIMEPCIQLYNDLVAGYHNERDIWERIKIERDIESHLEYNQSKLSFLFDIFLKALLEVDSDKVMFARNHDSILNLLCTEEGKSQIYDIVNIDHHHDILYSEDGHREVENFDFTSLNNWVWYLNKYNRVRKYTWVKNPNSQEFVEPNTDFCLDFIYESTTDYLDPNLIEPRFDYVFVCCSPEWFPERYLHFFLILKQMAFNVKGIEYETRMDRYCVDEKSRPYEKLEIKK